MHNIAIIFGGKSVEHDISILTAVQVLNVAKTLAYNVIPIYLKGGEWYTGTALFYIDFYKDFDPKRLEKVFILDGKLYKKSGIKRMVAKIDAALLCTHGGEGENGQLQGLLTCNGIQVCSSGTEASAVTMNKLYTTVLADALEIDVPPYMSICTRQHTSKRTLIPRIQKNLGDKVIIKPAHLGSSIGITVADTADKIEEGLDLAFRYDTDVLCMECLPLDYELNVALFEKDGKIIFSDIEKPQRSQEILTFDDKYMEGNAKGMEGMDRELPAIIPIELSARVRRWAKRLYQELDLKGIVRIDFLVSKGYLYFNEINTVPGSLALYLFRDYSMQDLIKMQIEEAMGRKDLVTREFSSSVLSAHNFQKS